MPHVGRGVRLLFSLLLAHLGASQLICDTTQAGRAKIAAQALSQLEEDYHIIEGNLTFHVGGNPAGRYGVCRFPEYMLPSALLNASRSTGAFPIPLNLSFLMGPQDAVIWFGCTPPPVRYFSIRSYLAFRFEKDGFNLSTINGYMPAAEFTDPLNNAVIKTTGGEHDPFSKTTLLVSTGDGATNRRVRQAFRQAGFPEEAMNLDVVPHEKTRFRNHHLPWALDLSDTIAWQYRVNEFVNQEEAAAYLDTVWPVYRLSPKHPHHKLPSASSSSSSSRHKKAMDPEPLTAPEFRPRGNGKSEDWLRPALQKLTAAVEEKLAKERGLVLTHQFQMAPNVPDNDRCMTDMDYCPIAKPIPSWNKTMCIPTCDWFSRDSLYSMPPDTTDFPNMNLPEDRTLVIVGVNHPLVGKSSFLNILCTGINNPERPGHTPNFSSSHLAGSGAYYLPQEPDSAFLYAQILSRDCAPTAPFCELVDKKCIDYGEDIYFAERAYLEPTTAIGPSPDEIISPLVLAFDPKPSSSSSLSNTRHVEKPVLRKRPPIAGMEDLPLGSGVKEERKWTFQFNLEDIGEDQIASA